MLFSAKVCTVHAFTQKCMSFPLNAFSQFSLLLHKHKSLVNECVIAPERVVIIVDILVVVIAVMLFLL